MDIFCPVCGEPWDLYALHDVPGVPFEAARRRFAGEGCRVFGSTHNSAVDSDRATKPAVLHQLLGDDIDGIAAAGGEYPTCGAPLSIHECVRPPGHEGPHACDSECDLGHLREDELAKDGSS